MKILNDNNIRIELEQKNESDELNNILLEQHIKNYIMINTEKIGDKIILSINLDTIAIKEHLNNNEL